jgi:uncharacterized membrane protein
MIPGRVLGYILLAVGVALLIFGLRSTDKVGEKITEGVTGHYTDTTMWYIVGGIAAAVGGGAMVLFGGRRPVSNA